MIENSIVGVARRIDVAVDADHAEAEELRRTLASAGYTCELAPSVFDRKRRCASSTSERTSSAEGSCPVETNDMWSIRAPPFLVRAANQVYALHRCVSARCALPALPCCSSSALCAWRTTPVLPIKARSGNSRNVTPRSCDSSSRRSRVATVSLIARSTSTRSSATTPWRYADRGVRMTWSRSAHRKHAGSRSLRLSPRLSRQCT